MFKLIKFLFLVVLQYSTVMLYCPQGEIVSIALFQNPALKWDYEQMKDNIIGNTLYWWAKKCIIIEIIKNTNDFDDVAFHLLVSI